MAGLYSAGEVAVDVVPDTSGFRSRLNAFLHSLDDVVRVGVDLDSARARRGIDSLTRDRRMTVAVDGDGSNLRRVLDSYKRELDDLGRRQVTPDVRLDVEPWKRDLRAMRQSVESETGKAADKAKHSVAAMFNGTVRQMRELQTTHGEYVTAVRNAEKTVAAITDAEKERYDELAESIGKSSDKAAKAKARVDAATASLAKFNKQLDSARGKGSQPLIAKLENERIPNATRRLEDYQRKLDDVADKTRLLENEQSNLFGAEYRKRLDAASKKVKNATTALHEYESGLKEAAVQYRRSASASDDFQNITYRMVSSAARLLDMDKRQQEAMQSHRQQVDKTVDAQSMLADAMRHLPYQRYKSDLDSAGRSMAGNRDKTRDLTAALSAQDKELRQLSEAMAKLKPYGFDKDIAKRLNDMRARLRTMQGIAKRNPIRLEAFMDTSQWERKYDKLMADATALGRRLRETNDVDIRVKYWEDGADRLEQRLQKLTHERVDIPVEWQVDQQAIIDRMREVAKQIKANPERAVEIEADLDMNMRDGEAEMKRFEDEHDKLEMDLDMQTALASAHLAYLTRPRTVDVFATVKATNLGKILNGMTYGATGLKGVENQFQRLVTLFDSLDEKVPAFGILGSAAASVSAGLLNLTSSALGVGSSILTMSKAALAAPAALSGMAAAGYVGYQVFQDAKEKITSTGTALTGLNHQLGESAWGEYGDTVLGVIDRIAPAVRTGMNGIAVEEGRMVAGVANVVARANDLNQLPAIFQNTRLAVQNLNPGVQQLVAAFLNLGDSTSRYLPRATAYLSDMARGWAQWVESASQTGRIDEAMSKVVEQGGYLKSSIMSITGVFAGLYSGLAESQNGIEGISKSLAAADNAINSFKAQETLRSWADGAKQAQENFRSSFTGVGDDLYALRDTVAQVFADAGSIMGSGLSNISRLFASSKSGISDFSTGVREGFTQVFDAIGRSGPMFSSLLTMVGELSSTFGGTLANALRAAAPLIETIANATTLLSKAFSMLPGPVQSMIALYMTFGRAGKQAIDSLKAGMLANIQSSLQYRKTLAQVGMSASSATPKLRELAAAMQAVNRGEISGALSSSATGIRQIGTSAIQAAAELDRMGPAFRNAGASAVVVTKGMSGWDAAIGSTESKVASLATRFEGAAAGAKSFGGEVLEALGGKGGVAVTAAFAGITFAMDDYAAKAQATEAASADISSAIQNISSNADDAANHLSQLGQAAQSAFKDSKYGETGFNWLNDLSTGFDSVADAAKVSGVGLDELSSAASGSDAQFDQLVGRLNEASNETQITASGVNQMSAQFTIGAKAAQKQVAGMVSFRDELKKQQRDLAAQNGYAKDYVDNLYRMGDSSDQVSAKIQSQTQLMQNAANASEMLSRAQSDSATSAMRLRQAHSDYQTTLDSMGGKISEINSLMAGGQHVWDTTANDFDFMSEAGREASSSLSALAQSGNEYLESMIQSGASVEQVKSAQAGLAQSFYDTAVAMGVPEQQARELRDTYLLTPDKIETTFTAKVESAKMDMLSYLSLIRSTFPSGNGQAIYNAIVNAITSGAVTDITGVQKLAQQYTNGNYQAVITADDQQVLLSMASINQLGIQFDGSKYTTTLNANDLASTKIDDVVAALSASGLDGKTIQMILQAKGDAKLTIDQTQSALTRLGASAKDVDIVINAQNHSKAEVDEAIANISKLTGMSKREIEFMLDATDNASPKVEDLERKKAPAAKGIKFDIDADDEQAQVKLARYESRDGQTIATSRVRIDGEDDTSDATESAKSNIMGVPRSWWTYLFGSDGISGMAGNASAAILGIPSQWWSMLYGSDGTSPLAAMARAAVLAVPPAWLSTLQGFDFTSGPANNAGGAVRSVPESWQSNMMGFDNASGQANRAKSSIENVPREHLSNIAANVSGLGAVESLGAAIGRLASKTIDIVTNFITNGSPSGHSATGGRIKGPGTGTSDSVPMMLSNGEMVIKASSVRKLDQQYGPSFLNRLNTSGTVSNTSNQTVMRAMRAAVASANVGGVDVSGMSIEVNPVVNVTTDPALAAGVREMNDQLHGLTNRVDALAVSLPQTIADNSSPWPSKPAFARDVRSVS